MFVLCVFGQCHPQLCAHICWEEEEEEEGTVAQKGLLKSGNTHASSRWLLQLSAAENWVS